MPSKFGGIPVEGGSKFGGVPVSSERPGFSNVRGGVGVTVRDQSNLGMAERLAAGVATAPADAILALSQMTGIGSKKWQDETQARIDAARSTTAGKVGGFAGEVGMMAVPATKVAKLGRAGQWLGTIALGASSGALHGTHEGESRLANMAIGASAGAAGQGGSEVLTALGRRAANAIAPEVRNLGRRAQELGIPVHAAQVSQSLPVKVAASAGKYLPFSGVSKSAARQQEAFNSAVGDTFGAAAPKLTDNVMDAARTRIGAGYDDIYSRNNVPLDMPALQQLTGAHNTALRRLTEDQGRVLSNQLDDVLANVENGALTGPKYQALRSEMMKAEKSGGVLGDAIKDLRRSLDSVADRSVGPQDAGKLKALRSQWANLKVTQKALEQVAGSGGDVRAASLWPLIRNGSTKEMRELARIGQQVLKDPIADSGTAQRSLMYSLLTGGAGLANPAILPMLAKAGLAGATVGRAANSNALARLLLRDNPGLTRQFMGQQLARPAGIAGGFPFMGEPEQP